MENFLRKIKLIDSFSTTLNTSKSEFTLALRNNVDEADIDGIFSGAFEAFTSSKNRYKGLVNHNGFKIRKRRRFFERNIGNVKAEGELRERGDNLIIDTKINGFSNYMLFFYGFISIIYLIFFVSLFSEGFSGDSELPLIAPIFILIHAAFMFGIPYFIMKRSVRRLRGDLEREFHFILSKSSSIR